MNNIYIYITKVAVTADRKLGKIAKATVYVRVNIYIYRSKGGERGVRHKKHFKKSI